MKSQSRGCRAREEHGDRASESAHRAAEEDRALFRPLAAVAADHMQAALTLQM